MKFEMFEQHPRYIETQKKLALYYKTGGQYEAARDIYDYLILEQKKNVKNYEFFGLPRDLNELALIHIFGGQYGKAVDAIERAIKIDKNEKNMDV